MNTLRSISLSYIFNCTGTITVELSINTLVSLMNKLMYYQVINCTYACNMQRM